MSGKEKNFIVFYCLLFKSRYKNILIKGLFVGNVGVDFMIIEVKLKLKFVVGGFFFEG